MFPDLTVPWKKNRRGKEFMFIPLYYKDQSMRSKEGFEVRDLSENVLVFSYFLRAKEFIYVYYGKIEGSMFS